MFQSYVSRAGAFREGRSSPLALAERALERLRAEEPQLRAFVHIDAEGVLRQARLSEVRWREGRPLSRLDGALVAVKDIIETADLPTGQGAMPWSGFRGRRDAASVAALRQAGAIVLGKTTTTEYALMELFASTTNPHDPERSPGGSSSGSAAVVGAGIAPLALATQVIGSTVRPASYCGCFGFKPTVGGLNRGGVYDCFSHSCLGVLAGSLEDLWEAACEIADRAGGDPGFAGMEAARPLPRARMPKRLLALQTAGWRNAGAGARRAFDRRLAALRQAGVEVAQRGDTPALDEFEQLIDDAMALNWRILCWELRWPQGEYFSRDPGGMGRTTIRRLQEGLAMTRKDYEQALKEREKLRRAVRSVLRGYDGFILLSATGAAPRGFAHTGDGGMNVAISLLGLPAMSLPLLQDEGMPLGLQLAAAPGREADLAAMARWVCEQA